MASMFAPDSIKRGPQAICQGNPCWCGAHPEGKPKPPQGVRPYSAKRAKQWLADRAKQREEAARG